MGRLARLALVLVLALAWGATASAKPKVVPAALKCDPAPRIEKGNSHMSMGQYAAALASYEGALRCKLDDDTYAKAFMASCRGQNKAKAKLYYGKLSAATQQTLIQVCLQQNLDPRK